MKRQRYFDEIATFKARFSDLPTESLKARLADGRLMKAAAVALRELIEEREPRPDSQPTSGT